MARSRRPLVGQHRIQRRSARQLKTKVQLYHAHLVPLMVHVHRRNFSAEHKWTRPQLLAVTPTKIMNFLKLKIYDDADVDPDVTPPKRYRSNTIKSWKKAWSFFMVNKMTNWDEVTKRGNPTRCAEINALIGSLIKMEVARRGMPSCARRSLVKDEYTSIICQLGRNDVVIGSWLTAYFSFQVSMIARVDDTAKMRREELQTLHSFPEYGVTAKLCWAKNCREERNAPTQIIFGSADWRYDVLSLLGVWLETLYESSELDNEFIFDAIGAQCPITIKESVAYYLRALLKSDDIEGIAKAIIGNIGTHSLRKYGTNLARGSGCSKDEVDLRSRWKSDKRQQDLYADTTIPYVDGKVAASLCPGGPVAYLPKDGSGVTDEWFRDHVTPNLVAAGVPPQVCVVLGRAILWKVFEASVSVDAESHCIPPALSQRVLSAYNDLGDRCALESEENPVAKLPLGVTGVDAQLIVDVIMQDEDNATRSGGNWQATAGLDRQEIRLLSSQVLHMRREFGDMREELNRGAHMNKAAFTRVSRSLLRMSISPAMRLVRAAPPGEEQLDTPGTAPALLPILSMRPKVVHDLWKEYMFGGPGRKAAKDFTPSERGACKHVYSLRKPLWDKVSELVRHGIVATVACDRVYDAYGRNLAVTTILRLMKRDLRTGDWPEPMVIRAE
jgi:hypothetical protein